MEDSRHSFTCEVAFADTDASGWAHFSKILTYVEKAEHDFIRQSGLPIFGSEGGWPRVKIGCDYIQPLLFDELITVHLKIFRLGAASITWDFSIQKSDGTEAVKGQMTTVRVGVEGKPIIIPDAERTIFETLCA